MKTLETISNLEYLTIGYTEMGHFFHFQSINKQYLYSSGISATFTSMELDVETGYSYFGARYLDHELLTAWLSVDPMADKYPSLSPYAYCAWNPVKLVDPLGMDTIFSFATQLLDPERNAENMQIYAWMREEGNTPGLVTFSMHGGPQSVAYPVCNGLAEDPYSDDKTIGFINKLYSDQMLPDYEKNEQNGIPTIFLLYSCYTGKGEDSFAEQLSGKLHGITIAPQGLLRLNAETHTMRVTTSKEDSTPQPWNVFYRGRKVLSFEGVTPKEWIDSMGGIEAATEYIIDRDGKNHPWE